MVICL